MNRRALVLAGLALPATALVSSLPARGQSCDLPTPEDIEGPFYKPGAPPKGSFVEADSSAPKLVLTGLVLSMSGCRPLPGIRLEFWHANDNPAKRAAPTAG